MCYIPFDRSFLQLSNGIRHVMPSTDTKPELTAKASTSQPVSQPAVYANGLIDSINLDVHLPFRYFFFFCVSREYFDQKITCPLAVLEYCIDLSKYRDIDLFL
jgi:hypothetical protein